MPTGQLNLLDLAAYDGGIGYQIIDETLEESPELEIIPAETIVGTAMELSVLNELPGGGNSFRHLNEGTARTKGKMGTKTFEAMIVSRQVAVDREALRTSKDITRVLETESVVQMRQVMADISNQFWYGKNIDAKGFPGLIAQHSTAASHNHNVGGTTGKSSAWFIDARRGKIEFLFGNETTLSMSQQWKEETLYDANSLAYQGLVNWINGRVGLRLANKHSAVRIKNISEEAGKDLNDTVLYKAWRLCRTNRLRPTHLLMTARSHEQWRTSRTATNPTGAPAPLPTEFEGAKVVVTSNISDAETI